LENDRAVEQVLAAQGKQKSGYCFKNIFHFFVKFYVLGTLNLFTPWACFVLKNKMALLKKPWLACLLL